MGNTKRTNIEPISPNSFGALDQDFSKVTLEPVPINQPTRLTIDANPELVEAIKDYSYWRGMTQKEAMAYILENFFQENPPKPRPAEVIKRAAQRREKDKRHQRRKKLV
jgi:hypothetical protein